MIKKGQQINKLKLKETGKYYVLNGGISPSGYFDMYNTPMNTISISEGGNSCGFVTLNKEHFWSGGHNYTLSNLSIDTNYLFQYLKKQEQFIMTLRTGSGLPNIQKSRLENIIIFFPQKEEQIKLSKFFLDLDVLIQQQKIKLEYLNQLKKAMLEKMFPKENSNIPELRFKGFTETWEQRKLGVEFERVNERNDGSFGINHWISVAKMYFQEPEKVTSNNLDTRTYVMRVGDIAFEGHPNKEFMFGKLVANDIGDGIISELFPIYRHKQKYYNLFWKYAIQLEGTMRPIFAKAITSSGASSNKLNNEHFLREVILVPSLEEQTKIGDFFHILDNLITLHQYMYNKLFQVKNNIFPLYSAFYSNILHNFLPIIFTYAQPQYKLHTKKIY